MDPNYEEVLVTLDRRATMANNGSMIVLDPVAETRATPKARPRHVLKTLRGKRVAIIWGQHVSSRNFWPALEKAIETIYEPTEIHRLYKASTWNPASPSQIEELANKIDYAVIGVGG